MPVHLQPSHHSGGMVPTGSSATPPLAVHWACVAERSSVLVLLVVLVLLRGVWVAHSRRWVRAHRTRVPRLILHGRRARDTTGHVRSLNAAGRRAERRDVLARRGLPGVVRGRAGCVVGCPHARGLRGVRNEDVQRGTASWARYRLAATGGAVHVFAQATLVEVVPACGRTVFRGRVDARVAEDACPSFWREAPCRGRCVPDSSRRRRVPDASWYGSWARGGLARPPWLQ
mmetsp:Transcript_2944/g.6536  ORF Transcript_2944/g.6536 Transcript_2944/m.6536 type:complete len:230 (-) Transcript_2944:103-792(-)